MNFIFYLINYFFNVIMLGVLSEVGHLHNQMGSHKFSYLYNVNNSSDFNIANASEGWSAACMSLCKT